MGLLFSFHPGCSSQEKTPGEDRQPAAAGRFYPGNPQELKATLSELFSQSKPRTVPNVIGIAAPHAGYVFSGIVAASAYNQLDPEKDYDNIFVIASSHQVSFMGASIYNRGNYITPIGTVPVNIPLANKLIENHPVFTFHPEADHTEHSIEVQIPFLQYRLKKEFQLIPIVLGTQSEESCKKIAMALKPYFNEKNLFVFSTDFSHYPSHNDAVSADKVTCEAILKNSPDVLMKTLHEYKKRNIPNLVTNLCGWTSILTMLYMTAHDPGITITPIQYMNSGDSKYGDTSQVVGYWALAISKALKTKNGAENFNFSQNEKAALLNIARNTLTSYIRQRRVPDMDSAGFSQNLLMKAGAFVTLHKNGELRGCIGRFTSDVPLYKVVQQMTIAASTEDSRFDVVTPGEIDQLEIEISVLSPMKRIYSPDDIVVGKHGIYIKKGYFSGTFLPQVATETGWTREEFLGHCARDKAGIGWDGWKDAELYTYEACVFQESELNVRKD